jgi:NADPH:quinone reductase-like Zn-dependent oxidoreductase
MGFSRNKNNQSLASRGRLLLVGVVGGGVVLVNLGPIIMRDLSILGVTVFEAPRRDLASVVKEVSRGKLRPVIDKTFTLEELQQCKNSLRIGINLVMSF